MDKEHVYGLIRAIALDCIEFYKKNKKAIISDTFSNSYESYPLLRYASTGYPYFTKSDNFKINYSILFYKETELTNKSSFINYLEYILKDDEYCSFYNLGIYSISSMNRTKEVTEWLMSKLYVLHVIDRYFQLHNKLKFQEDAFRKICFEWLNCITKKELGFNLVIPILMTTFSFKKFQLSDEIEICKMDNQFQKSRHNYVSENSSANERVVASATHAFRITKNSYIKSDSNSMSFLNKNKELAQVTDLLFGYLRLVTNCITGYAQLIIEPVGWAQSWIADLNPLIINTTRAYPTIFEEHRYWYDKPDEISKNQLSHFNFSLYLNTVNNNRSIKIAILRLNSVYIREGEADIILDIAIGLEAIYLEANDNEGVTHKLASRSALLCKNHPLDDLTTEDVFIATKKMYAFRSAIVHSKADKEIEKAKMIKLHDNKEIKAVHYGIKLLSHTINTMIMNPEYLDPKNLDALLYK